MNKEIDEEIDYCPEARNDLEGALECKKRLQSEKTDRNLRIYTSEFCNNCGIVKSFFMKNKIEFEEVSTSSASVSAMLLNKGFEHLPVVEYNGELTNNLTRESMQKLIEQIRGDKNE